jgi:hypothetical protein
LLAWLPESSRSRVTVSYGAYLRGAKALSSIHEAKDILAPIAAFTEAIRLDPHYALAFASRSLALSNVAAQADTPAAAREGFTKAQADARQALALAPDLAQAHLALAFVSKLGNLDFMRASEEYDRGPGARAGQCRGFAN